MNFIEWKAIQKELPPLQRKLSELDLDTLVAVTFIGGLRQQGTVEETDDPRILRLRENLGPTCVMLSTIDIMQVAAFSTYVKEPA